MTLRGLVIRILILVPQFVFILVMSVIVAAYRRKKRTSNWEIACEKLTNTSMFQDRLHARTDTEVEAVLCRGWILVIDGCWIGFGFGGWRPVDGGVEGAIKPRHV